MKWQAVLVSVLVFSMPAARIEAASCDANCGPGYGNAYGAVDGITAYYNGDICTGFGNGCYQCVELIKRYFAAKFGINYSGYGYAYNYWYGIDGRPDLRKYQNHTRDGLPQDGDAIVFQGGPYGHIAMVSGRTATQVQIVQQNWPGATPYANLSLSVDTSGNIHVGNQSSYYVLGWVRAVKGGVPVPPPSSAAPGAIVGLASKCLDVYGSRTEDRTAIDLYDCGAQAQLNQTWTYRANWIRSHLGSNNKCLDVTNTSTANGTPIQLYDCKGTNGVGVDAQRFTLYPTGEIKGVGNKCLDATGGSTANGTRIILWDCNQTSHQRWRYVNGQIQGVGGKCLDVPGSSTNNGTAIQLYDCGLSQSNQLWDFVGAAITTSLAGSKCLDVTGGNSTSGTKVQLYSCNQTAAQRWLISGKTISGLAGKCLDVIGSNSTSGTLIDIWDCTGNPNQLWYYVTPP